MCRFTGQQYRHKAHLSMHIWAASHFTSFVRFQSKQVRVLPLPAVPPLSLSLIQSLTILCLVCNYACPISLAPVSSTQLRTWYLSFSCHPWKQLWTRLLLGQNWVVEKDQLLYHKFRICCTVFFLEIILVYIYSTFIIQLTNSYDKWFEDEVSKLKKII